MIGERTTGRSCFISWIETSSHGKRKGNNHFSILIADGLDIFIIKSVNNCMVAGNAKSKINPVRVPEAVYENSNALYMFAEHQGL